MKKKKELRTELEAVQQDKDINRRPSWKRHRIGKDEKAGLSGFICLASFISQVHENGVSVTNELRIKKSKVIGKKLLE